jgi:hypothetical protein
MLDVNETKKVQGMETEKCVYSKRLQDTEYHKHNEDIREELAITNISTVIQILGISG